ncbi:hypothetical protein [Caulobacter sp. UNC279MFTsu5.1]|uniref:hypothetical protein n=1 Tax=Caulobacter sp. UNC279MFTsu5.1 TaxID=1502775 RepID=UPI00037D5615|nr:hypothetical protein [Caulobacter sp. UNC279MFTsu5.1]SFJ47487.1 hypothetical protein SAMN02799626_01877 [Caulobacter sp. UNC279MFTsu5.1]
MLFAYLVQTEGVLPRVFRELVGRTNVDVHHLTFRDPQPGAIHLPGSTWTEGRNALLQAARAAGRDYDYFIFCDDDVVFTRGSWDALEEALTRWRPAVGLPSHPHPHDHREIHAVYDFDAIVNAFHRDVVEDQVLLPYIATYDAATWWLSQFFVIHLAGALYPRQVVKFPDIAIENPEHRAYPRISAEAFGAYRDIYLGLWRDRDFAADAFRVHYETRDDPPFAPVFSQAYTLAPALRSKLANR